MKTYVYGEVSKSFKSFLICLIIFQLISIFCWSLQLYITIMSLIFTVSELLYCIFNYFKLQKFKNFGVKTNTLEYKELKKLYDSLSSDMKMGIDKYTKDLYTTEIRGMFKEIIVLLFLILSFVFITCKNFSVI